MRSQISRLFFSYAVGLVGLGALILLTPWARLSPYLLPLTFFILLSFIVKRAGVYAAPDTLHSLVGIVDLAAILLFGPTPGAWVPALSSSIFIILNTLTREPRPLGRALESPLYTAGLKGLMGLASGGVYLALGGPLPPRDLSAANVIPTGAAILTWYLLDNLGWGIWEWLHVGWRNFSRLFRDTLAYSILVELIPLPFSMVIAVVYTTFGGISRAIFLLMAAGLVEVAFVLQRYAEAQQHLERRSNELIALNEFGEAVSRAGFDPEQILEQLVRFARRITQADLYRVELFTPEQDAARPRVELRGGKVEWLREETPLSPAAVYLRDNPASIRVQDLSQDRLPFAVDDRVDGQPARAGLFIPLLAADKVVGALTVLNARPRTLYRVSERNLNAMASQAAVALENANLYALERRRAVQLATVSEVGRQVALFLDLDELLSQIVREICDRFGYSHVHIFALNAENQLVFRASTHPLVQEWQRRREQIPAGEGIVGRVFSTGEPILAADVTREPSYLPGPDRALVNTRSELAVPLVVGHEILGVLDVQSEEPGRFGEEDLFLLRTLAAQIAIAIEDARLYASQKEEAWFLNVMLQVSENLADTATLDEALETVVRITPILLGIARCAIFLYDARTQTFRAARQYGLPPEALPAFDNLVISLESDPPRAFARVYETRAPVVVEDAASSELLKPELASVFGLESLLFTPLIYRGAIVGAMVVDQGPRPRRFTPHEIQVLMGISNQAAVAIENARLNEEAEVKKRLDYELGLARQIQSSFLPPCCPEAPGFQLSASWRAAREVSGDFYDFISLPGHRLGFSIADVSDKGMPAALFMVLTRTLIRAMAIGKQTPKEALERANDLILADSNTDMFATALYGVLDPGGDFIFTNAGHNPPLWLNRATGELRTLRGHGLALGVKPDLDLPEQRIHLGPGDVLLLYTDGITEALNPAGDEFGSERLAELLRANAARPANDLVDAILESVYDFTQGAPQFDDMTMVVIKRQA